MSKLVTALCLFTVITVAQPQAYVPLLFPLKQTNPALPAELRDQQLSGIVRLLLTVDTEGNVTESEPLEGPQALRQPAMDAVKTWKFRPVLRDGKAVFSYTDASVSFFDEGRPVRVHFDPDDARAANQRLWGLQEKMPRSAAQKLADLEQDAQGEQSSGNQGLRRYFFLGRMAKAALEADAPDKASAYATELLDTAPKQHQTGNAIHDGNVVLGLVAIQKDNVDKAKEYLLKAGKTAGAPNLNSFGPNMLLAKKLLEKGEKDTVLEYFTECRA